MLLSLVLSSCLTLFGLLSYFSGATSDEDIRPKNKLRVELETAEINWSARLSNQSATYTAFAAEYQRRYSRKSPSGMETWWALARTNKHQLLDEYDSMMRSLGPFRRLSGKEVRRRAEQVGNLPSINLVRVQSGVMDVIYTPYADVEAGARARGLVKLCETFAHLLPDMIIPVNGRAEGRILVPWRTQSQQFRSIEEALGGSFIADWKGDGNVWQAFRKVCPPNSTARRLMHVLRPRKIFASPIRLEHREHDLCQHPVKRWQYGHLFSDWRTISALYPVFSHSRPFGFADILFPSHYYNVPSRSYTYGFSTSNQSARAIDPREPGWREKVDRLFWRGATTGGGSTPFGFASGYQRHRFVRLANDTGHQYWNNTLEAWQALRPVFDVAFTGGSFCDIYPGGCRELTSTHRHADKVDLSENWKYKYVMDLDGQGYSGRFMALMTSFSAVFKASAYEEFWSDWIQPWFHYVPVSYAYSELPDIMAYFQEHDRISEQIGQNGREWTQTMTRRIDQQCMCVVISSHADSVHAPFVTGMGRSVQPRTCGRERSLDRHENDMISCVIPSRPVRAINAEHHVLNIADPYSVTRLALFLQSPLGQNVIARAYFSLDANAPLNTWSLVCSLDDNCPSAIVSLPLGDPSKALVGSETEGIIGISIQPSTEAAVNTDDTPSHVVLALASKILKQLFYYLGGFEAENGMVRLDMNLLKGWHDSFLQKLANGGVAFLNKLE